MKTIGIIVILSLAFSCNKSIKDSPNQIESHNHEEENEHSAYLTDAQIAAMDFKIGQLEKKTIGGTIKAHGYLKVPSKNKANATSMFGGVVKSLEVQIGDYVKKGQIIARIENPEFIKIQEEYLSIKNRMNLINRELERQKMLQEGGAGALKNLQNTEAEIADLKIRNAAIQKQLRLMAIEPNHLSPENMRSGIVVTSPINGSISEVNAKIGTYIDVSTPVAEVIDNTKLHLDLEVYEKDLKYMKIGQRINFVLSNDPGEQYEAEIYTVGSTFEGENKTVAMHAKILNKEKKFIDGMGVTGIVHSKENTTWAVPNDAIVSTGGKYYIFLKKEYHAEEKTTEFERIEVIPGDAELGYTSITAINTLSERNEVLRKGAFFANATLEQTEGHSH